MMTGNWTENLARALDLDHGRVFLDEQTRRRLSTDYYHYSQILQEQLADKLAEAVIRPGSEDQVRTVLAFAADRKIPVTVRGAGTGNYGQAMPLEGGIVLHMTDLDDILEIDSERARVEAGVRLGRLEARARERGAELRIYPSTYDTSTAAGFVCGGSTGVGGIEWGSLWDGNVDEIVLFTMESEPRRLTITGDDIKNYVHNYGTTGVVTQVVLPFAPRHEWAQMMLFFERLDDAYRFSHELARETSFHRRNISTHEWPIPRFFKPLLDIVEPYEGHACTLIEVEESAERQIEEMVSRHRGEIGHRIPASRYHEGYELSLFSWNHTTLWARKADSRWTYYQAAFDPEVDPLLEQLHTVKDRYGDDVLMHHEWVQWAGDPAVFALFLLRFQGKEHLREMKQFCESIGLDVWDPHTYRLDEGGMETEVQKILVNKPENDPHGLLNPGKIDGVH